MVYYRQRIINQIKSASNTTEIDVLIEYFLQRMKMNNVNGHIIQRFILCMGVDIDREKTEKHSARAMSNLSYAIDLLKKLQNHS